jgi:NIMA (never in mitosis gene a)-related kinase
MIHLLLLSVRTVSVLSTEKLLSVDVVAIGCGPHHVAVLSRDGEMYTWGRGDGGRLGLGHEEDWYLAQSLKINNIIIVFDCRLFNHTV